VAELAAAQQKANDIAASLFSRTAELSEGMARLQQGAAQSNTLGKLEEVLAEMRAAVGAVRATQGGQTRGGESSSDDEESDTVVPETQQLQQDSPLSSPSEDESSNDGLKARGGSTWKVGSAKNAAKNTRSAKNFVSPPPKAGGAGAGGGKSGRTPPVRTPPPRASKKSAAAAAAKPKGGDVKSSPSWTFADATASKRRRR
jgi:hypothetical protein